MSFTGQVLSWDSNTTSETVFQTIDTRLTILVNGDPNGTVGAANEGIFAYRASTQEMWICRVAGAIGVAEWQPIYFSTQVATTNAAGVVKLATNQDVLTGTANDAAITPFAIAGIFAKASDVSAMDANLSDSIDQLTADLSIAQAFLATATANLLSNSLMRRDANNNVSVADAVHTTHAVTLSQLNTVSTSLQSQIDAIGESTVSATSAATPATVIKRDGFGRAQVASPSASADIATKGYADALGTDAATPSTILRRDAAGRAKIVSPSATDEIANKGYVDSAASAPGVSAPTPSTTVKRDASGRAQVVSPSASADIATKGYADALGVSAPTPSTILRRDASGRAQVVSPATTDDIATKGYVDSSLGTPGVSAPTPSTTVKRDASGRAQVVDPSANADIATKGYADALGTDVATPSTIMRRDFYGRTKAAAASASDDVVIKSQLDLATVFDPTVCHMRVSLSTTDAGWGHVDVTNSANVYIHPVLSRRIGIWNGINTVLMTLSAYLTVSLAGKTAGNYRVYVWDNNADNVIDSAELVAWSNDTTPPADTIADGYYVKTGATSRRAIADIMLHGTAQCDWMPKRRGICQLDHRLRRETALLAAPTTTSWSVAKDTTPRRINAGSTVGEHLVEFIVSDSLAGIRPVVRVDAYAYAVSGSGSGSPNYGVGFNINSTSTNVAQLTKRYSDLTNTNGLVEAHGFITSSVGKNQLNFLESNEPSSGSRTVDVTGYATYGAVSLQSGMEAFVTL